MIHLISPVHFERWSPDSPDSTGIGGSETAHIEMDKYLSSVGYGVKNWIPLLGEENDRWHDHSGLSFDDYPGDTFIIYRDPSVLDEVTEDHKAQGARFWFVAQDVDAPWTQERLDKVDRFLTLCHDHSLYTLGRYPSLAGRIFQTSNGIKTAQIREVLGDISGIQRHPKRVVYTSCPTRGLLTLLNLWPRVLEYVPDAELRVCYGFDNVFKLVDKGDKRHIKLMSDIEEALNHPRMNRVTFTGRLPQTQLWNEYLGAGLWWYPNHFSETSCISCMEAQALGAIPVTNTLWALAQNVFFGAVTEGIPTYDWTASVEQVHHVVDLMKHPEIQNDIRAQMMPFAQDLFDWNNVGKQWQRWLEND